MREQATDWTLLQEITGHAAKRPFPQPRVSVGARDHQVDVLVLDQPKQRIRGRNIGRSQSLGDGLDAMASQIIADILDRAQGLVASGLENLDDHHGLGLLQERQCVEDRAAGFAYVLPGDCHVLGRK